MGAEPMKKEKKERNEDIKARVGDLIYESYVQNLLGMKPLADIMKQV